ncbi:Asp23/Gls24 family envelope stress response protein (plasmid) [Streptomyces sp. BI20]|uniref:Asp23/Gls24 family envelope stress response protein n=1 Tax=Streptomyces sp. BI20 TaxID=3403460 RepID=UPI003C75D504
MAVNPPGAPPPRHAPDTEHLPCGRNLATLWDAWEAGAPEPHDAVCPHCAAALRDLTHLRHAALTVHAPTPPHDTPDASSPSLDTTALTGRIMDAVRLELRPGHRLPLGGSDEDTWIHESAATRTLRTITERVPGVRVLRCGILPSTTDDRAPVTTRLEISAGHDHDLRDLADRVRRAVRTGADHELGLAVSTVDVHITDLHEPATPTTPPSPALPPPPAPRTPGPTTPHTPPPEHP